MDTGSTVGKAARSVEGSSSGAVGDQTPYAGLEGRTRLEPMLVTLPDGQVRSIQVYRVVNVGTDPKLHEAATTGALHRFESGEELAVPFVFHDPAGQKLCVVVPEALRHTALDERAALLTRIAKDTAYAVPAYVREATVVVGSRELKAYLTLPAVVATRAQLAQREAQLAQRDIQQAQREAQLVQREAHAVARDADLHQREELIVQREERLAIRGEGLTRREDELRTMQEEVEAGQRDLTLREEELESRVAALREREVEAQRASTVSVTALPVPAPAPTPAAATAGIVTLSSVSLPARLPSVRPAPVGVERKSEPEPMHAPTAVARAPVPADVEDDAEDDVEELVDEDEVAEELDELDGVESVEDTGVGPVPTSPAPSTDEIVLDEGKTTVGSAALVAGMRPAPKVEPEVVPGATVPPPPGFLRDLEREMAVLVEEGVRLFARLDDGREKAFDAGADLLVQLATVQGYPVALLALVAAGDDARPYVRRAAIDPRDPKQRLALDALRRHFAARIALYAADGRYLRTIELVARREPNAGLVADRASKTTEAQIDGATACERALAAPPPVREAGHPFTLADDAPAASSAHDAASAIARLASWATPERIDRALLVLSVPRELVDATFRRVLEDAIDFGMALPVALRDRAVALGLANEPGELVTRQIESFRKTASTKTQGGLSALAIATNWEALLAGATEYEIAIDSDTHDIAWTAIRAAKGEASAGSAEAEIDLSKLGQMGPPELVLLLEHPRARRAAAIELCRRGDAELVDAVYKAVRKMPRSEVVRVAAKVVGFGEAAGDVLIDGLSARKTFVRQASALALGQLELRRAVVPLLHLLQSEKSGVWKEVARVLGGLGQAAYRPLLRAAKEPKSPDDRLAYALAHAANGGSRKALQAVAKDASEGDRLMRIAQQAIVLEDEAKRDAQEVLGERPYDCGDPVKSFSRRFYQELAGTAPDGDLDDV
jgi:hypothetical protein